MELKDMIVSVVYQSPNGLAPVQIVEKLAAQYQEKTTATQVIHIVSKNPKVLADVNGIIKSPEHHPID